MIGLHNHGTVKYCNRLQKAAVEFEILQDTYVFAKMALLTTTNKNCFVRAKNTGPWKGRLKRFFVNAKAIELAKNNN